MKNRSIVIVLSAIVLCMIASCAPEPMVSLSKTSFAATNDATDFTLDVTTTYDWTASSSAGWVKLSPSKGAQGVTPVSVKLDANNTFDDRTATVTFSSEGLTATLSITQSQKDAILISTSNYHLSFESDTIDVELLANVDYSYSIPDTANWVKVIQTKGLKQSHVLFRIEENAGYAPRQTAITFTDKAKGISKPVTILQDPLIHFDMSVDSLALAYDEKEFVVTITTNAAFQWNTSGCTWVDCSDQPEFIPGERKDYELHFTAESNPSHASRDGEVVFTDANKVKYTLRILQEGSPYILVTVASGKVVTAPLVKETSEDALIDWGDGTREAYKPGKTHTYAGTGQHTITITSVKATRLYLENLRGVERLDFHLF